MEVIDLGKCMVKLDKVLSEDFGFSDEEKLDVLEVLRNYYDKRVSITGGSDDDWNDDDEDGEDWSDFSEENTDSFDDTGLSDDDDDDDDGLPLVVPDPEEDYDKLVETSPRRKTEVKTPVKKEDNDDDDDDDFESLGIDNAEKPQKKVIPVVKKSKPVRPPIKPSVEDDDDFDDEELSLN